MKTQHQAKILVLFLVNFGERRSHLPNITTLEIFQRSPDHQSTVLSVLCFCFGICGRLPSKEEKNEAQSSSEKIGSSDLEMDPPR